jgi:hypothetical protein
MGAGCPGRIVSVLYLGTIRDAVALFAELAADPVEDLGLIRLGIDATGLMLVVLIAAHFCSRFVVGRL